jgi:calcium permeable stress-gated cation channel
LVVIAITYSAIAPLILGFATVGLYLFYFAFRYNLLYVNAAKIDTKGLVYPRALQHVLVGCYLSIICLIGLFGIQAAPGPLVLMVVFGIFCILYHISLNSALDPLLYYLPRSLEAEEESLMQAEEGTLHSPSRATGTSFEKTGVNGSRAPTETPTDKQLPMTPAPHKKPGLFAKFFRPDLYTDYATLRRLVPRDFGPIEYSDEIQREAYHHPAITDRPPLLWVPRDAVGVSRQECAHTSQIIPMTDEGAYLDDKGKMVVTKDETAPIFEEKVYY